MLVEQLSDAPAGCNDNNERAWTPLRTQPFPAAVQRAWWARQPLWIQAQLAACFPELVIDDFVLPQEELIDEAVRGHFYRWFRSLYDFDRFASCVDGSEVIPLSVAATAELRELCTIGVLRPESRPNLDACYALQAFFPALRDALIRLGAGGAFVKSSAKSGKDVGPLHPAYTIDDVFESLVHSPHVLHNLDSKTSLILVPWIAAISPNTEFRAFVEGGRVLGVSQQLWYMPLPIDVADLEGLEAALDALVARLPYADTVLDIFYHTGQLTLVEANVGGSWQAGGSALFRWSELRAIASGAAEPCVRLRLES